MSKIKVVTFKVDTGLMERISERADRLTAESVPHRNITIQELLNIAIFEYLKNNE